MARRASGGRILATQLRTTVGAASTTRELGPWLWRRRVHAVADVASDPAATRVTTTIASVRGGQRITTSASAATTAVSATNHLPPEPCTKSFRTAVGAST